MRYASKEKLVQDIEEEHASLMAALAEIPRARYDEPGVWGDDWSINDLVAHLTAWHRLFLGWYRDGLEGGTPALPAPGYKWNETPRLNREIWRRNRDRPTAELWEAFEASHAEVLGLARRLSPDELLTPGVFGWTKDNALVTYLAANTASHYRFARRVLKRWARSHDRAGGGC